MKNFNQRGGFGRPSFGGGDRRDRGPVTMHKATCAECHNVCEVPFRPNGEKPVYCSNCFGGKRDGGNDRGPRKDFGSRPSFAPSFERSRENNNDGLKRQLDSISIKLDQLARSVDRLVEIKTPAVTTKMIVKDPVVKKTKTKTKKS